MVKQRGGGLFRQDIKTHTTMKNELSLLASKALPALSGAQLTYDTARNMFLTMGYTSAMGNLYYKAIRVSKRLAVMYHIGEGYLYTFLNGITLVAWNGQKGEVIAQKFWGGSNWRCFTEQSAKEQSVIMLRDFFAGQAKALGHNVSDKELLEFSRSMIEETRCKQLTA